MSTYQKMSRGIPPKKYKSIDWVIFYLVLILLGIGVTMVFSASYIQAGIKYQDSLIFLKKDLFFSFVGLIVMYVTSKIDYRVYKKLAMPIMMINIILLAITLTMEPISNSRRWIRLQGFTFQTSELTKYACILMTATILSNRKNRVKKFRTVFEPLIYVGASIGLIMLQRDLSTSVTIVFVCLAMIFVAGGSFPYLFSVATAGMVAGLVLLSKGGKSAEDYQSGRVASYLKSLREGIDGMHHQTQQSVLAFASGGPRGLGLGRSRQKFFYLPEPQNDFIFAIIGEELGYVGTIVILLLLTFLVGKCMALAFKAPDFFGSMVAAGIGLQIGIQVLFNVGVATGVLPNTGIPLPFISYGGTSLLITLGAMGVILNISRHTAKK